MKMITVRIDCDVLVTEAEFERLNLTNRMAREHVAGDLDSYISQAPLFRGKEHTIRVGVKPERSEDEVKALELVA